MSVKRTEKLPAKCARPLVFFYFFKLINSSTFENFCSVRIKAQEEKIPDDELPPYLRPPKPINMDEVKNLGVEGIKAASKKGKSLMMFVTVSGAPTEAETETITSLWQSALFNGNLPCTRYIMEKNKAIFMIDDGSTAWEIKDFLVKQERCLEVTIDNEIYPGLYAKETDSNVAKKGEL